MYRHPRAAVIAFAFAFAALSTLTVAACEALPEGDKTSVYYWSDVYLDLYEDKLVVGDLEPGPGALEEPRPVLLITGVTIAEAWFDPIVARLERDGFVPYVYEPPALLSGSLFQATYDLADVVEELLEETGRDKIDVLAECTGGVVARHYIQSLGGDEKVSRLVTFVSPHNGIAKAPWAAKIADWPALRDLSPGSDFLEAVNSVPLPEQVPFTSIYTCSDEYIRPTSTSIVEGAKNIGLCDGFVGHFETFYQPWIYRIMHEALTEPLPEAEAEPEAEPEPETVPETASEVVPEGESEIVAETEVEAPGLAGADEAQPLSPDADTGDGSDGAGCQSGDGSGSGLGWVFLCLALALVWRRRPVLRVST